MLSKCLTSDEQKFEPEILLRFSHSTQQRRQEYVNRNTREIFGQHRKIRNFHFDSKKYKERKSKVEMLGPSQGVLKLKKTLIHDHYSSLVV